MLQDSILVNTNLAKKLRRYGMLVLSVSWFLVSSGCGRQELTTTVRTKPENAPGRILTLDGQPVNPFRDDERMPVVLLFVRTDCPISNRYAPEIRRLAREFGNKSKFWLVYADGEETPEQIRKHVKEFEFDCEVVRDLDHVLVGMGRAHVTPEAAVFDSGHTLVYHGRIDDWFVKFGEARPAATTHELKDVLSALTAGQKSVVRPAPAVGCAISPNS